MTPNGNTNRPLESSARPGATLPSAHLNNAPGAPARSMGAPSPDAHLTRDNTHQLITEIARALVDSPDEVFVEAVERDENTVLRLHVSQPDIGKVIGKQGRTAHSMRTILSAVSMKYHHRYTLDIVERDVERETDSKREQGGAAPGGG